MKAGPQSHSIFFFFQPYSTDLLVSSPPIVNHSLLDEYSLTSSVAIASNYGEGTSAKAVSTYFERAKKDPQWNLANTIAENGNGGGSAVKPKATPRKRTPAKGKKNLSSNNSDDDEEMDTPSKPKSVLNKVASGRVTKPGRASAKKASYAELSDDEDDGDMDMIKPEPEGFVDLPTRKSTNGRSNGHFNGHSNGNSFTSQSNASLFSGGGYSNNGHHSNLNSQKWSNSHTQGDEDYFHDVDEGDEA